ncbi:MAG: hypothetical protein WC796_01150 [Candidatus Pacearchaeota archaeon]|jgi:hypothetical protein
MKEKQEIGKYDRCIEIGKLVYRLASIPSIILTAVIVGEIIRSPWDREGTDAFFDRPETVELKKIDSDPYEDVVVKLHSGDTLLFYGSKSGKFVRASSQEEKAYSSSRLEELSKETDELKSRLSK